MDGKVVLNKQAFKALASETRIDVLKLLDARRMTQTELARSLGVTVQSVSEHLSQLEKAELVKRKDEGRKWVYFELTESGMAILHPERKAFWVILGVSALMLTFSFFNIFNMRAGAMAAQAGALSQEAAPMMAKGSAENMQIAGDAMAQVAQSAPAVEGLILTPFDLALLLAGSLLFGASVTYLFAKKRNVMYSLILLAGAGAVIAFVLQ